MKTLKKFITPLILVLVLGGLIAGYLIFKNINDTDTSAGVSNGEDEAEAGISVIDKSDKTVTKIDMGGELQFSYINDAWQWDKDEKFPADSEKLTKIAVALSKIDAFKAVEKGELSDFGLDDGNDSLMTVKAEFSDSQAFTYKFGETNSFNGYQYFLLSDDENVYLIDSTVANNFEVDLKSLTKTDPWQLSEDSIYASAVSSILLETADGLSNEITDETGISELYDEVYQLNLKDWETYFADSETKASEYGISETGNRVTVTYTKENKTTDADGIITDEGSETKTYTLYLGSTYTDGDTEGNYYSPENSAFVYKTSDDGVSKILDFIDYVPEDTTAEE